MTETDSARAISIWNEQQQTRASATTHVGFDNLFILKDSSGHVLGAVTHNGSTLSQDELRAYRVMASCRR